MCKKLLQGFTLIELLIVIAIIIILVGIGFLVIGNYQYKQNDERRQNDMTALASAVERFKADHGHYPYINWHPGEHAYEALGGDIVDCNNNIGTSATTGTHPNYIPGYVGDPDNFRPGTEIKYDNDLNYYDDLSLQLTGRVYLPKMPVNETVDPEWITDQDDIDPGTPGIQKDPRLKVYMTEVPKDPLIVQDDVTIRTVCMREGSCTECCPDWGAKPTADYERNPSHPFDILFRYHFNSYYQCSLQGINLGDQYSVSTITQLMSNGVYDDPTFDPDATGLYFYEIGSINFYREPETVCN